MKGNKQNIKNMLKSGLLKADT